MKKISFPYLKSIVKNISLENIKKLFINQRFLGDSRWSKIEDDDDTKPDDNADETSSNPQNVAWLTDAGAMAYEDLVEAAKLGSTVIVGGYIKTSLLTANNITTGTLDALLIRSSDANTRIELNPTDDAIYLYQNGNLRIGIGAGVMAFLTSAGVGSGEIYGVGTNKMGMNVDGAYAYYWDGSGFYPSTPGIYDLGLSTNEWGNIYAQGSLYDGAGNHETIANIVAGGSFSCSDLNSCSLANIGTRAHSDLTGVTASQHHTKTTSLAHSAITSVTASQHHSSVSDGLNITPRSVYLVDGTHKVYGPYTSITLETSGSSSGGITIEGGTNGVSVPGNLKDIEYLYFNSSYARIYNGAGLALDFYSDTIRSSENWCPATSGSQSLGTASYYWADVSYKTLTDRGCLGIFDNKVELQDGRKVSNLEALESIKKHSTLQTTYGEPRFDYTTMPKSVYKKADDGKGNELPRDEQDRPYSINKETKEKVHAEDGAEITALISIMIGSIKEMGSRIKELEIKVES